VEVKGTTEDIEKVITQGRNAMPAFGQFQTRELRALSTYLKTAPGATAGAGPTRAADRYTIDGYPLFLDQNGVPAISPPWGTLNAVDLVTGDLLWKVPLGEYPQLVAKGIRNTGSLNFGGAVATAGGVIFIAATADEKFRAIEKATGRTLWEFQLPAGGYATPSVYMIDGRQYVAIAAGGSGKNATKSGDSIIAFALPAQERRASPPPSASSDWIDLFDGNVAERLGPDERRAPLHCRGWRDRWAHGRGERQHEFLPVHVTGVRRFRAGTGNCDRPDHQFGNPDQERGASAANHRQGI
jgi:quinoprotein glucose dehydrogenase